MRHVAFHCFAMLLACASSTVAWAQGTITDGPVSFARTNSSFDATPLANLLGATSSPTADPLFEVGWAFRVLGDTRETFFPLPTTQNYTGNTSTHAWNDVASRGLFNAQEVSVLTNVGGPSARMQMTMTITNRSATTPLVISVFHAIDVDVAGTAPSDNGSMMPAPLYRISMDDVAVPAETAQYYGVAPDAYAVRMFSAANDVFGLLDDALVTDFDSTGVPFANIDMTGVMQWADETIAPGASASFVARFAINTHAFVELPDPLFEDGFENLPAR